MTIIRKYRFLVGTVAVLSILGVAIISSGYLKAQGQSVGNIKANTNKSQDVFSVGIYEPQAAFQQHPARAELLKSLQESRMSMQAAREDADQQKMQQLQQEYERNRDQAIEKYQKDLDEALPEVAKEFNLDAVAVEVVYKGNDVRTTDITPKIIEVFSEKYEKEGDSENNQPPMLPVQ